MEKDYILFDLDGTLTDPKIGITKSVQYSLKAFGIEVDCDDLLSFIGPPLRDSYKKFYSFSEEEAEKAVEKYREYFSDKGIFENSVYGGIPELLESLKQAEKTLIVATSKPEVYAKQILEHFGMDKYFSFVSGSELDGRRSKKDLVIRYALDFMGINSVQKAVMIGDREHDIIGANIVGIESIGVLYGYGNTPELLAAGATKIAGTVEELSCILNTGKKK